MKNGKTFVKITNEDIYNRIELIDIKMNKLSSMGKINRWIATTALSLVIGLLIGHIA